MGVTTYLTTDLAAIPLLWVIPLVIYLLSFILAFARSGARVVRVMSRLLPYVVAPLVLVMSAGFAHAVWIPLHLAAFFAGCVACHGALAQARPAAEHGQHVLLDDRRRRPAGRHLHRTRRPAGVQPGRRVSAGNDSGLCWSLLARDAAFQWANACEMWLGDLLLPGIVFFLTAVLATNQVGLAESLLGVLAVMIASGLGLLAYVTARRRPMRFALDRCRGAGGEWSLERCQRPVDPCGTQLLRRGARDA